MDGRDVLLVGLGGLWQVSRVHRKRLQPTSRSKQHQAGNASAAITDSHALVPIPREATGYEKKRLHDKQRKRAIKYGNKRGEGG